MQGAHEREIQNRRARDLSVGALLFCATTAFCLWQNSRVAALFDLSYLLDSSWRISLGQLPYRDFPFAHAPGTFLLHALITRISGRVYWPHVACAAIESGTGTVITWHILLRALRPFGKRAWWMATILAATPVPLGVYSIYPHPIYDGDAVLAVLVALCFFVHAAETWSKYTGVQTRRRAAQADVLLNLAAGAICVVPALFKQNIGLAFLGAAFLPVTAILAVRAARRESIALEAWFLAGVFSAILLALAALHFTVGLANYRYWTLTFAAQRRLPGFATVFGVYHQASLLWTVPAAIVGLVLLRTESSRAKVFRLIAFFLLAAPFLWTIIVLAITSDPDDRAGQLLALWPHLLALACILAIVQIVRFLWGRTSSVHAILPVLPLATIHGAFLSQQLWGSTYALWPLLIVSTAMLLIEVREIAAPLAATIAATLLMCGTLYAASLERLEYIHRDGSVAHAALPALRGMSTPGPWLPEFEVMVRLTDKEIPTREGVVLIPGEEPFYFATGRTPQFPVLLTDLATDPYTPAQTAAEIRARNIRWLIVKRDLQLMAPPEYETPELLDAVERNFILARSIPGYDIYRRK